MGFFAALLPAAATVVGSLIGAKSNKSAARTAVQGSEQANAELRAAKQRGVTAITTGKEAAKAELAPVAAYSAPGASYLRQVALTPATTLTPAQRIAREDLRRTTGRSLAAAGLRGAGRSGVAVLADTDRRFMADAQERNQTRQDRAAGTLEGRYADTARAKSGLEDISGRAIASTEVGAGSATASNLMDAADTKANAQLATGQLVGSTLGNLAGIYADEQRQKKVQGLARPATSGV